MLLSLPSRSTSLPSTETGKASGQGAGEGLKPRGWAEEQVPSLLGCAQPHAVTLLHMPTPHLPRQAACRSLEQAYRNCSFSQQQVRASNAPAGPQSLWLGPSSASGDGFQPQGFYPLRSSPNQVFWLPQCFSEQILKTHCSWMT